MITTHLRTARSKAWAIGNAGKDTEMEGQMLLVGKEPTPHN